MNVFSRDTDKIKTGDFRLNHHHFILLNYHFGVCTLDYALNNLYHALLLTYYIMAKILAKFTKTATYEFELLKTLLCLCYHLVIYETLHHSLHKLVYVNSVSTSLSYAQIKDLLA